MNGLRVNRSVRRYITSSEVMCRATSIASPDSVYSSGPGPLVPRIDCFAADRDRSRNLHGTGFPNPLSLRPLRAGRTGVHNLVIPVHDCIAGPCAAE